MHAIEAYLLYFTHFTLISLANVAPKKSASPGSEKSHCSEIGLPGCNVHSNGPSLELQWAQSCSKNSNGPSLALRMALTCAPGGTCIAFAPCNTFPLLHRARHAQYLSIAHRMPFGPKSWLMRIGEKIIDCISHMRLSWAQKPCFTWKYLHWN